MMVSVTYYLELGNALYTIYLIFYRKMLHWLFGHHKTLPTLLGRELQQ